MQTNYSCSKRIVFLCLFPADVTQAVGTGFCVQGISKDSPSTCGRLLPSAPLRVPGGDIWPGRSRRQKTLQKHLQVSSGFPLWFPWAILLSHALRNDLHPAMCSLEAQGPSGELQWSRMETTGEGKRKTTSRGSSGNESPQYTLKISRQSCC